MRVCQFRHDGNLNCNAVAAPRPPCQEDQPFYSCSPITACQTKPFTTKDEDTENTEEEKL